MLGASALIWAMPLVASAPAPVLSAVSLDVLSTAAGGSADVTGTFLSGADQARIGDGTTWTTAAISGTPTSTSATFTMPSGVAAGSYQLQVHTAGGWSNSLVIYVEVSPLLWLWADRAVASGGKVSSLPNTAQGGLALVPAQANATAQPIVNASDATANGAPTLSFDGVSTQLVSSVLGTGTSIPITLYAVARWESFGSAFLLDDVDGSSRICLFDAGAAGGALNVYWTGYQIMGGTLAANAWNVFAVTLNVSGAAIYQNDMTTPAYSNSAISAGALKSIRIGSRYTSESLFKGRFGCLAAYAGVHDATTRGRVGGRLKTKYGVA